MCSCLKVFCPQLYDIGIFMLHIVLNKSWKQHPTKLQLYGHLPPISRSNTCWRSKDDLLGNVLSTATHGHISVDQQAKIYIHQLYANTGCHRDDFPRAMVDRNGWYRKSREPMLSASLDINYIKYSFLIQIICPQSYSFKYFYLILIIYTQLYDFM